MVKMQQLGLSETIGKVEQLIEAGNGDPDRLCHILEFLKSNNLFIILIKCIWKIN